MTEEEQQALDQLKTIIEEWRHNKTHVAEKMPDFIYNNIIEFLKTTKLPEFKVLKYIRIDSTSIKRRRESLKLITENKNISNIQSDNKSNQSLLNEKLDKTIQTTLVEMQRPDGTQIKFHIRDDRFSEFLSILS